MNSSASRESMRPEHLRALRTIIGRLRDSSVDWALTGSCSFAVQGLPVQPNDIDIQTDKEGAYEIEWLFSTEVVEKVRFLESDKVRSYFGALMIDEVRIEIMGDIEKRESDGSWGKPVELDHYKIFVEYEGMQVPVLLLEYECEAYKALGRRDRAKMLNNWLSQKRDRIYPLCDFSVPARIDGIEYMCYLDFAFEKTSFIEPSY
jgi:hypothetical protein